MNSFDPFKYQNCFHTYKLKIKAEEINQVLILVKNLNTGNQKTTYNYLNVLNFPILKNLKQREGGGYLNKGDVSLVGERGPELMVAKQDVNIVANRDIKFIPPSLKSKTPTTTIVRTIIQKQGTKIVNRTKIM